MIRFCFLAALLVAAPPAAAVQRVVTLAPHLAELVCAAGGCDKLVGVVEWTDYPPQAAAVRKVGDAFNVNPEAVLPLMPDLVLAWDGGTARAVGERLARLGLRVEWIRVRRLGDIADALERVGALLGSAAAARPAAQQFRAGLAALAQEQAGKSPVRVLYQIETEPIYTVNRESPISQALELCGGVNVFAGLAQLAAPVGRESILDADPEAIVFARQDDVARIRAGWQRWPQVAAVRRGHLYAIDAGVLERATPRMLEGITQLCALLDQVRAGSPNP